MKRAGELIERFAARRPLAVRLAEAVSLAVLADPRLLRKARLDLVPEADPGTEADLWMSPLVQTRSPDGLVFASEVGEELRTRLAESPARLEKAWGITQTMHRHLTPALRLEEEIAFLSLTSESDPRAAERIEELLRSALAAVVMGEMRGLAHWAARALPKLPSRVRVTQAARLLEAGAHLRLGGAARPLRNAQEILDSPWMAPADLPRVAVGVRLFPDTVELDARPDPPGQRLLLPQTEPLLVELSWQDPASGDRDARQVTFRKGEMHKIEVPVQDLRLRTVLGEVYDLRAAGTAPRGVQDWIIDFSKELARHRPFFGRKDERERIGRVIREESSDQRAPGRLILVTGEIGAGKSALLSQFVGPETPHHFFRRGQELEDLGRAERSLVGQIVRRFPALANMAAHRSLPEVLESLTARGLVTRETSPLVLVLDGIDEARSDNASDGLLGLLAEGRMPDGVVILASAADQERDLPGPMDHVPLTDAEPSLREYWSHYLGESDEIFTQLSAGNFGVAEVLRSWIQEQGTSFMRSRQRALVTIWESLERQMGSTARDSVLGSLAAAFEPLPASFLSRSVQIDPIPLVGKLLRVHETEGEPLYELREEVLREFVDSQLDLADYHAELALDAEEAIFAESSSAQARKYGLRHAAEHRIAAGELESDLLFLLRADYLTARCQESGIAAARRDLRRWLDALHLGIDVAGVQSKSIFVSQVKDRASEHVAAVLKALVQEEPLLTRDPAALPSILYNSLRIAGLEAAEITDVLALPPGEPRLRLRTAPEEVKRTGFGRHLGKVTGCAFVELDSPSILSWSTDGTLRVWNGADGTQGNVFRAQITLCVPLDEGWAVSASRDCDLRLWSTLSNSLVRTMWGHEGEILGVLAADTRRAVSWSADRTIRVWDLEDGREMTVFRGHEGAVTACAVTPDLRYLVSGSADATVRIWDLASGALIRTERGHTGPVTCVVAPEGDFVYSGSLDRTLRVWSLDGEQESQVLEGHALGILGCAVSPDDLILATWSYDRTVRLWRLPGFDQAKWGEAVFFDSRIHPLATLTGHEGAVLSCAFFSEGDRLVSCSADRTVRIWDLDTRSVLAILQGHEAAVRSVAIRSLQESRLRAPHPLTALIASASDDRTIRIWDAQDPGEETVLDGDNATLLCLPFQDRQRVLTFSRLGDLRIHHLDDPVPGWLGSPSMSVGGGILTPNDRRLILWSQGLVDGKVRFTVWDLAEQKEIAEFSGHEGGVLACAVTPDARRLLSASLDGTVRLWNLGERREVRVLEAGAPVVDIQVSPDGFFVLAACWDGKVRSWDLRLETNAELSGHTDRVLACAFAPDGLRAVSASADQTLRLWDLQTGSALAVLTGHTAEVNGCAFTRDGHRIVSRSKDGRLGLWDGESGKLIAFTQGHTDWVTAFALDEEAGLVYTASEDQTVRAWALATGEPRGVVYGVSPFRSLAAVQGGVYAGDEAGNLWPLESVVEKSAS